MKPSQSTATTALQQAILDRCVEPKSMAELIEALSEHPNVRSTVYALVHQNKLINRAMQDGKRVHRWGMYQAAPHAVAGSGAHHTFDFRPLLSAWWQGWRTTA